MIVYKNTKGGDKMSPPSELEKRDIYFFRCVKCKTGRRITLKLEKAEKGLCRTCRKQQIPDGQESLF